MNKLLHDLGFTYKKPKLIPSGLNLQLQENFLECFYKFMSTKKDDEVVIFFDSTHPQYLSCADYGWIKKGNDMLLQNHGMRGRVNISGGVDLDTGQIIVDFPEKVNSKTIITILQKIENCYPNANIIHLILDNAAVHKSKLVKDFLNTSKLNMAFLPAYSPNLNLMERIWGLLRRKVLTNSFISTFKKFRNKIIKFFKKTLVDKNDAWVWPLINDEFQEFEGNLII